MPRTLVVGFDGAVLDLADRWMEAGRMPALSAIAADGASARLRSVYPYNSAVAWVTLATGLSPGRHGVFDFVLPAVGEYRLRVATRHDRRTPALWNHAAAAGARVAVVNVPMTFPAEPVPGVMVAGMDAPRLDDRAVHPASLLEPLRASGYRIMSNAAARAGRGDFDGAERELLDALEARADFVCELARPREFDLLMVNLEATDGAHHFFWQHHDPGHPRHDPPAARRWGDTIGRVYEATDRALGALIDAFAPDTVVVASDHGGGPSNDAVLFMNDWLEAEGLLRLLPHRRGSVTRRAYGALRARLPVPVRRAIRPLLGGAVDRARGTALYGDVDWLRTRAYAQMQSGVRLNLVGREPAGAVGPGDREAVLALLRDRALALRLPDGGPAFSSVRDAGEVYRGGAPGGWDVILETAPGLHVRSRNTTGRPGHLRRLEALGTYLPSGVHTPAGMVVAAGAGVERRGRVAECDLHQVAPSVLALMGVPAPALDGDPFEFVSAGQVRSDRLPRADSLAGADLEAEEEAEVLERLRGLGYVD